MEAKHDAEIFLDNKTTLILLATATSKTATEISHDCNMPLSTTYRKLDKLLQCNLVKICGKISDGKRYLLFTNNARMHHFKNSQRVLNIMNIIIQNPGFTFRDIVRASGLSNGVISHYLQQLQKTGLLRIKRSKRKSWHFTSDVSVQEMDLIIHLRNETSWEILSKLLWRCLTFYDLTKKIDRCPASISLRLSRLVSEGFVKKTSGLHPMYFLRDNKLVLKTISRVRPQISINASPPVNP